MKLAEHTEHIRQLIDKAFRNRLGRMGITEGKLSPIDTIPVEYRDERKRIEIIREVFIAETGTVGDAYEKLVEELTFTLFNRLAALKVLEAHILHPEIVTQRDAHGSRSFAHLAWLEQHPEARNAEAEGLVSFIEEQLFKLAGDIPLFSPQHPYHLLPTPLELKSIIKSFNQVETDTQVETEIWKSDDVLGWLYESYNNKKKQAHKDSKADIEFNHVSLRSQTYTPRWVVKFLVDNSLGKLYLEMYPDSEVKNKYKIANAPKIQTRERKPLHEIRLIDPSNGSGNFLLYSFDLYYDLYLDNINEQGNPNDYDKGDIAKLIIEHNLHGIDLDDRAVQLAQLGLYIKAKRKKRTIKIDHFNVVSSDFFLPEYKDVKHLFEDGKPLDVQLEKIVIELWKDLQQAYKFGSLIQLDEKFRLQLNGLVKEERQTLFTQENLLKYEAFRNTFFTNLQKAVAQNSATQGQNFLNTKTQDAITFLQLLTQKYDVAVANPPYTDSADFGPELKTFVDLNYQKPHRFNSNLYAAFIKRCYELIEEKGKMALIHPLTFMYIKTFEDVRKFIISNLSINVFVDYGLSNLFGTVLVDPVFYVMEREKPSQEAWFISLDQYSRTSLEKFKKDFCLEALEDYVISKKNKNNYSLNQYKLKVIEGWPFIYWISDEFREKFKGKSLGKVADIRAGIQTSNNDRFLRLWWEVDKDNIILDKDIDRYQKRWAIYSKGGPYSKWAGNLWCIIDWKNDGSYLQEYLNSVGQDLHAKEYYFREGITYSASSSKGVSFRYYPDFCLFDIKGSCVFLKSKGNVINLEYVIALLNSKLSMYIAGCLNSTVETQVGDIKRVPYLDPPITLEKTISNLSKQNVQLKIDLNSYSLIEVNFQKNILREFNDALIRNRVLSYLNYENKIITSILISEAYINQKILSIYELSEEDRQQVESKMGKPVGDLAIMDDARKAYCDAEPIVDDVVLAHIHSLPTIEFEQQQLLKIRTEFVSLYQSSNDLEEFCIRHQINPINVWYWFKEANILPTARTQEIALEFLADAIRTILMADEDGIIPLVELPSKQSLLYLLEQHCLNMEFTSAQFIQMDSLLGRSVNEYLEGYFFKNLSDHLNLFMYLPKTPFIWHLSSGPFQGFEAYIIIYKWNRDSLFKLKSQYLSKRVESLEYRQIQLKDLNTAQNQDEKEKIRQQLKEIESFTKKIDELIAEGYDPKLDDGVGKNIAPLQKKALLKADVLSPNQLKKYLNADW